MTLTPPKLNEYPNQDRWDTALWFGMACGLVGSTLLLLGACWAVGWVIQLLT